MRSVSDCVAVIAEISGLDGTLQKRIAKKQREMHRFRQVMAHLAEAWPSNSVAIPPQRRPSGHELAPIMHRTGRYYDDENRNYGDE